MGSCNQLHPFLDEGEGAASVRRCTGERFGLVYGETLSRPRCIYEMEGAEGCHAAVLIDGEPNLVSGENVKAHAAGLCTAAKPARVAGHVEGDGVVSTSLEIE